VLKKKSISITSGEERKIIHVLIKDRRSFAFTAAAVKHIRLLSLKSSVFVWIRSTWKKKKAEKSWTSGNEPVVQEKEQRQDYPAYKASSVETSKHDKDLWKQMWNESTCCKRSIPVQKQTYFLSVQHMGHLSLLAVALSTRQPKWITSISHACAASQKYMQVFFVGAGGKR